jgi:ribose/xylose/arabinose/galactoside ABC-type transport system permease subunit
MIKDKVKKVIGNIRRFTGRFHEINIFLVLIVLIISFALINNRFISFNNITNLLRSTSIIGVVSIGMTFVIISGGIDLSVGSVLALSSVIAARLMLAGVPVYLAIIISLATGALAGLIMGIIIYEARVPPFIVTLAGLSVFRGIAMLLTGAKKIIGLPVSFTDFAVKRFFGVPAMAIVWLFLIAIGVIITRFTVFGRNIYAIGSNQEAARLSGINIRASIYKVYALGGFASAVAGILMTARLAGGSPSAGGGYELDAIAATVLGGTSLTGGIGGVFGTFFGTMIIATISNGGNIMGINPFVLKIIIGVLIVLAVVFDHLQKRRGLSS